MCSLHFVQHDVPASAQERVVVFCLSSQPGVTCLMYAYVCVRGVGLWVGSGQDMGPEIKIPASYIDPRSDRADYIIYVHTTDVK